MLSVARDGFPQYNTDNSPIGPGDSKRRLTAGQTRPILDRLGWMVIA
jgi:hypothetical protein